MNMANGAIPPNLVCYSFIHFTCDNIDINDSNLDGKDSLHATQAAAWQCGPALDMALQNLKPLESTTHVPPVMDKLVPTGIIEGIVEPKSTTSTQKDWFIASKLVKCLKLMPLT